MENVIQWLGENWWWLALCVGLLVQVSQAATKHFSEYVGLVKVLTFATEVLSIFRSAGVAPGVAGNLKPPVVSVPPKRGDA